MSLEASVTQAIWLISSNTLKQVDSNPIYLRVINEALKSTSSNIDSIISKSYDKQKLLEEVDSLFEIWKDSWDVNYIDQALIIAYSIFDAINKKVNDSFHVSLDTDIEDISNSNNAFIRKLVRKINDLLMYKCSIIFWNWWDDRKKAEEIANIQIDDLSSWNYIGYSTYLKKWEDLRNWWYELMEAEKREELEWERVSEDRRFDFLWHWLRSWNKDISRLNRLLQEDEDKQKRYKIILNLWQIEQALDLCLERLDFFSPQQEIDWVYNYLDLIRNNLKKWKENILLLLNDKWLWINDKYYLWYFEILIRLRSFDEAWLLAKNRFLYTKDPSWKENLEYLIWNNLLSEKVKKIILSFVRQYWITE